MGVQLIAYVLVLMSLVSCNRNRGANPGGSQAPIDPLLATRKNHLWVTTSNYQAGLLESISLTKQTSEKQFPVHPDAIVRQFGDNIYVVNRLGADNIQIFPRDLSKMQAQYSVGRGTNAQDIAVINDATAYVTRFKSRTLLKISPNTGTIIVEIDMGFLSDEDGFPELSRMLVRNDRLYIQALRLSRTLRFVPTDYSALAVLNVADNSVSRVRLTGTNPVGDLRWGIDDKLYVATAGFMGSVSRLDGGIERVNPSSLSSEGFIITEAELGGDLVDFELLSENSGLGVAIVATANTDHLVGFDIVKRKVLKKLLTAKPFTLMQVLKDTERDIFYVASRDDMAIRIFDSKTFEERKGNEFKLTLAPFHMCLGE